MLDDRLKRTLVLAIVVAAGVIRIVGAIIRPAWHDEYFTSWVANLSWQDLVAALRLDSGPPLLYALSKLFSLDGLLPALACARGVSVIAGTIAVYLASRAAHRAFGSNSSILCAALLAFHPLTIAWSCEGRPYALLLLAVALAWERLETIATTGKGYVGLGLAVAVGCWSHAFGLVLAGTAIFAAMSLAEKPRRTAFIAVGLGVATYIPWLTVAIGQPPAATAWMTNLWRAMPLSERLLAPVRLIPPLSQVSNYVDLPAVPWPLQVLAALACIVLISSAQWRPRPALFFGLPAAGLVILAFIGVPAFYPSRAEALFLVPVVGILASGSRWPLLRGGIITSLSLAGLAVAAVAIVNWSFQPPRGEQLLAHAIAERLPNGGTVVIGGYWRLGITYHLGDRAKSFKMVNYPEAAASHPGWYDDNYDRAGKAELSTLADRITQSKKPVAVVVCPGIATIHDLNSLASNLDLKPSMSVSGGQLFTSGAGKDHI